MNIDIEGRAERQRKVNTTKPSAQLPVGISTDEQNRAAFARGRLRA